MARLPLVDFCSPPRLTPWCARPAWATALASIWCSASYASAASDRDWFFFTIGSTSRRTSIRSWTVAKVTLRYFCVRPDRWFLRSRSSLSSTVTFRILPSYRRRRNASTSCSQSGLVARRKYGAYRTCALKVSPSCCMK